MATCRNCNLLADISQEVEPNVGWCPMWCNWQKCRAQVCKHFVAKSRDSYQGRNQGGYRGNTRPRYKTTRSVR